MIIERKTYKASKPRRRLGRGNIKGAFIFPLLPSASLAELVLILLRLTRGSVS